jgi:acylphosphatase
MSDVNRVAFSVIVHGRVQGVGFRWSTRRAARDLGLAGQVRNMPDGTVEVIAEGPEAAMTAFQTWLTRGPTGARVDRLTVVAREPAGTSTTFEIR